MLPARSPARPASVCRPLLAVRLSSGIERIMGSSVLNQSQSRALRLGRWRET